MKCSTDIRGHPWKFPGFAKFSYIYLSRGVAVWRIEVCVLVSESNKRFARSTSAEEQRDTILDESHKKRILVPFPVKPDSGQHVKVSMQLGFIRRQLIGIKSTFRY